MKDMIARDIAEEYFVNREDRYIHLDMSKNSGRLDCPNTSPWRLHRPNCMILLLGTIYPPASI